MADQLYLSVWFPNFRLQSLPDALGAVLRQFALIARDGRPDSALGRVVAASAYPIDWTETPVYQRIYSHLNDPLDATPSSADAEASRIENAVPEATEQLHDDTAYEFEMRWLLWLPDLGSGFVADPDDEGIDDESMDDSTLKHDDAPGTAWRLQPSKVRITGFGPNFDAASYDQNGHIRIDFGLDTPWVLDTDTSAPLDSLGAEHIRQNVEKLLAFTLSVEKNCGISSRLLWTESGEPLAEKLIARLQRLN